MNENDKKRINRLIEKGVNENVYPGCVLLIAVKGEPVYLKETGHLSLIPYPVPMKKDTIFDLASLTKVLATTLAIMNLADKGLLNLDHPLSRLLRSCDLKGKAEITPRLLLNHCSGLIDWVPFYLDLVKYPFEKRKDILRKKIIEMPLKYPSGQACLYSDPGFMLLEWLIEEVSGSNLNEYLIKHFYGPLQLKKTFINGNAPPFERNLIAATEDCLWRKRIIQGDVHDENAFAAGGFSGHAGLFGTACEVFVITDMLMGHYYGLRNDFFKPETVKEFFRRQDIVKGSTWALGWDTPSQEGSSAGSGFSSESVGHLGFTGCSVWMDLMREITVIFLTNRVYPTRNNQKIKQFRPLLHDLIMDVTFNSAGLEAGKLGSFKA